VTLAALALTQAVKTRALEVGFDRVAVGPAGPAEHAARFDAWLDAGYAGGMDYLARTRVERGDPERLLPGCRSVVALALAYGPRQDDPSWRAVSRYARGRDYHDLMRPRLAAVVDYLREAGGPAIASRAAVDTSAVLERDLAARAGLGWIGKNTNLIAVGGGSYFFIGTVLTTAALVGRRAGDRPLRHVHGVSGRVPHERLRGPVGPRRPPVPGLPPARKRGPRGRRRARRSCVH
jgi:epoxyqueuosine reductase